MRLVETVTLVIALLAASAPAPRAADCSEAPGDVDFDGFCDAIDPCAYGFELREGDVSLRRLGAPHGNDSLRFKGIVPLPERMAPDPAATGLRVVVLDGGWTAEDLVLDVAAPGGSGWRVNAPGRSWSYRSSDRRTTGVTRAVVKEIAPNPAYVLPRQYAVVVEARRGTWAPTSDLESHMVSVAFAATGTTDECAVRAFYPRAYDFPPLEGVPVEEWMPACRLAATGRTLACTSGPRVGPCRVSLPNDWLLCDVQNAAAAQERFRIAHGTYHSGPCTELPGFSPSPDTSCSTVGTPTDFRIAVDSVLATYARCTWDSAGTPRITCD